MTQASPSESSPSTRRPGTHDVHLRIHPSPHPFVRKGLVRDAPRSARTGDIVTLLSPDGVVLGDALWNTTSDIAARRLTQGDVRFDEAVLVAALRRAVGLRHSIPGLVESSEVYRVVHSEGDGLSGLVVDKLGDVLSIELHAAGWADARWLDIIIETLSAELGTRHHHVVMNPRVARLEGVRPKTVHDPKRPAKFRVNEHGLRWEIRFDTGHKTGFFCDQRDNRAAFAAWVDGHDVLDLCCYTGGFGITAAALGAPKSVTAIDLDEKVLETAKRNAGLNQVRVSFTHADAFDWARQIGRGDRRFGAIVVDPPKFIPLRSEVGVGEGKYRDLNKLALELVEPGGTMLTCTCSGLLSLERFRELVMAAARKANRVVQVLGVSGAAPDHPVLLECPETEYLQALWLRVW